MLQTTSSLLKGTMGIAIHLMRLGVAKVFPLLAHISNL